jgi:hypothetical protein
MRGGDIQHESMFNYLSPEARMRGRRPNPVTWGTRSWKTAPGGFEIRPHKMNMVLTGLGKEFQDHRGEICFPET